MNTRDEQAADTILNQAAADSPYQAVMSDSAESLPEVSHHFKLVCENADGAFFVTDAHYQCIYMNPSAEKLTGYQSAELYGQRLHQKLFATRPDGASNPFEESPLFQACTENCSRVGEDFLICKDGSFHSISFAINPLSDHNAATNGAVIEIHSIEKDRRASRYLQQLNEAAVAIISANNLEEALETVTEQARAIIGAHQAITSVTNNQDWEKAVNAVSLSDKYAAWRTYSEKPNGNGLYMVVCCENRPLRLTQAEVEAHPAWRGFGEHAAEHPPLRGWLAVPLMARNNSNLGLIQLTDKYEGDFTPEDESVLIQLARLAAVAIENAAVYREAQEANRVKDEFLATMSHELRTPLMAILGWTHLLQSQQLDEDATTRALETIMRNGQAQRELIEDLLDVSRIITGKLLFDVQEVDANDIVLKTVDSLRPAAEDRLLNLQTVLDSSTGTISGDPARLQQVVWNLVSNAIKFTQRGGDVTIRIERTPTNLEIAVADNGQGIDPEFLPYVFDRFRQSDKKSTRHHGGLGLGLAIVRHLVELHGGTIRADSEGEGKGSVFTVQLPLAFKADDINIDAITGGDKTSANDNTEDSSAPISLNGIRVLVVDDEEDNRDMLQIILQRFGASVTVAPSAQAGLEIISRDSPDVLVSDIGMPDVDGYTFIGSIRALDDACSSTLPAIALTAYARPEDREKALAAGFQIYLTKPVDPTELATAVLKLARRDK